MGKQMKLRIAIFKIAFLYGFSEICTHYPVHFLLRLLFILVTVLLLMPVVEANLKYKDEKEYLNDCKNES